MGTNPNRVTTIETGLLYAVLAVPPLLLGWAALSAVWLLRRGVLRRVLAYLIVSRPRRAWFIGLAIVGISGFLVAGTVGVIGSMGSMPVAAVESMSSVGYLVGSASIFATVKVGLRDAPLVAGERREVEEFRGEVLSLGLVAGVDDIFDAVDEL